MDPNLLRPRDRPSPATGLQLLLSSTIEDVHMRHGWLPSIDVLKRKILKTRLRSQLRIPAGSAEEDKASPQALVEGRGRGDGR